jgi:hypothetical protein
MKVGNIPRKETPTKQPPILSLTIEDDEEKPKGKTVPHSLCVNPTDVDSNTYKSSIHVLDGTEDVWTLINHPTEINRVLTGLNATTIGNKLRVARTPHRQCLDAIRCHSATFGGNSHATLHLGCS